MIEIRQDPRNNENLFHDKKHDRLYSRIVAGLMLPSEKPGFLCVVAEEVVSWPPKDPHLFLLAEFESPAVDQFLSHAVALGRKYVLSQFIGRLNTPHSLILTQWNSKAYEERRRTIEITSPLYADSGGLFEFHISTLLSHLQPNRKTLHLGKKTRLPGLLMQLAADQISKVKDLEFPAVASLAYAVSYLNATRASSRPRQETTDNDYDPFTF